MLKQIVEDELRLLTFRAPSHAVATNWKAYLAFGLFFTWLAGVGRYWDNPRAELWQVAGLPAVLYAIPVERFMSSAHAAQANAWFLAIVAIWRVGLLGIFLRRVARLPWLQLVVATLLPLAIIVVSLAILNLEHVMFDLMTGIRDADKTANDMAYRIVFGLAYFSFTSAPILGIVYVVCVLRAWKRAQPPASTGRPASPSAR